MTHNSYNSVSDTGQNEIAGVNITQAFLDRVESQQQQGKELYGSLNVDAWNVYAEYSEYIEYSDSW